jgi:hypothetical protein
MSAVAVAIGALAVAVMFAASRPVVAGPVCNKVDLRTPCIGSNDIRANIALGGATGDALLRLRNADGANAVDLRASNSSLACWRCNTDPNETGLTATGHYEVDFTPLSTDITGRPRLAVLDGHTTFTPAHGTIILADRTGDPSSVLLRIRNEAGAAADAPFVLIIY